MLDKLEDWLGNLDTERLSGFPSMTYPILILNKADLLRENLKARGLDCTVVQERIASRILGLQVNGRRFLSVGFVSATEEENIAQILKEIVADFLDRMP